MPSPKLYFDQQWKQMLLLCMKKRKENGSGKGGLDISKENGERMTTISYFVFNFGFYGFFIGALGLL